jgi:hypothetical protein
MMVTNAGRGATPLRVAGAAAIGCTVLGWALAQGTVSWFLLAALVAGLGLFFLIGELGFESVVWWVVASVVAYPFVRFPSGSAYVTFDRAWIAGMVACIVLVPRAVRRTRPSRMFLWLATAVAAFYLARVLTTPLNKTQNLKLAVDGLILPLILFAVVSRGAVTEARRRRLAGAMSAAGGLLAVIGIASKMFGFQLATLTGGDVFFDRNIDLVRISGPYPVPEMYALSLVLCLAATLYWIQLRRRDWVYVVGATAAGLELMAIGITFFRAGWISAVIVIIAAFGLRPKRYGRLLAVVGTVGALIFMAYGQLESNSAFSNRIHNTNNVSSRFASYETAIELFKGAPLFGVGAGQFTVAAAAHPLIEVGGVNAELYPHSSYFGALAEEGLFLLIPLLAASVGAWYLIRAGRRSARTREQTLLVASVTGAGFAYLLFSLTLNVLQFGPSNSFFLILLGMLAGSVDQESARGRAPR